MYGASLDFSGVTLPGVGGGINASNAISGEQLKKLNAEGKKWAPDASGGMSHHNESVLNMHKTAREKRANLVNRDYNEQVDGAGAMKEIFDRKKSRMASFKEMKKNEYGFAEGDSQNFELLAGPIGSMGMKEHKCKGAGCPICANEKQKEAAYREWSTNKREKLEEGGVKGSFAGPDKSFPIASPEDVAAAWSSAGRGKQDPRVTMRNIIRIAKENGWESGLPDSVKKRLAAGESGLPG
jgi:hypothetical protein